jgi:serine carboxypeptidase-like clade 1
LDSPVGVGFSYSKNVSDYNTGDAKTASDTHTFLLKVRIFFGNFDILLTSPSLLFLPFFENYFS